MFYAADIITLLKQRQSLRHDNSLPGLPEYQTRQNLVTYQYICQAAGPVNATKIY